MLIFTLLAACLAAAASAQDSSSTKYFITFGDSYSQTGFEITGSWANAANPLGNPAFPGWTTNAGPNWIGRLLTQRNATTLLSYNFAHGGATTSAALVTPYEPAVRSLVDQVAQFSTSIATHPATAPWTSADTLFGMWIGINDVGNTWGLANVTAITDAIMGVYSDQLQILYDAGARKFVLLGVPPINKSPMMLAAGAEAAAQEAVVIARYNERLVSTVAAFAAANAGVTAKFVDTMVPFQTALDDPTTYGAADATCIDSDGTSCLWWNDYHPGLAIHNLVAEHVADAWSGDFFS